jgi:drug/metabolite transporter (DMT)-like permease
MTQQPRIDKGSTPTCVPAPTAGRRHHLDLTALVALVVCCALWGLNQVAIKAALPEVPSLVQLSIRSGVALALVLAWMKLRGLRFFDRDGTLWPGLFAGTLFAIEFGCIFVGLKYTTAARSVVFINTSPFVVALMLAWLIPSERLRPIQIVGLVLAFVAVAFAFNDPNSSQSGHSWVGDALIVVGAVLWGLTTVVIRTSALRATPPEKTLAYQLLVAAVLSPLASIAFGDAWPTHWSALALSSLFYQAVIVTFMSYLLWFWLLTRYPATQVQAFVFLSPVFGTGLAALLLNEPVGPRLLIGLAGVAVGIYLVSRKAPSSGARHDSKPGV